MRSLRVLQEPRALGGAGRRHDPANLLVRPDLLSRSRTPVRIILTITALAGAVALALLAFGPGGWLRLGPLALSVNNPTKPFAWGMAAGIGLLIAEWSRPYRRRLIVALLVAMGMLAVIGFGRGAAPIITDGDLAVGELYTELATRGALLVGPYSRFGWHHPGPLFFYLTAPFYALAGHRTPALYASALGLNVIAIIVMTWVVARERQRWLLAVILACGCTVFAWRVPMFLASPWTAHVPVLSSLTFLVIAAAVASGRVTLLPLLAIVGSFVAQTHVGFVPIIAAVAAGALAFCCFDRALDRRAAWRALSRSAWVLAALWLLPISEAVAGAGGNMAALWRFFVTDSAPGHSVRDAFFYWAYGLSGVLRPDFELPWGGHFQLSHLSWSVPCAVAQMLLLAAIARRDLRAGRRFEGCLSLVALSASLVSLWSVTRIRGDVLSHDVFRIAALGAFNLAIIAAACARAALAAVAGTWSQRSSVRVVAFLLTFGWLAVVGGRDLDGMTSFERRRTDRVVIVNAHAVLRDYLGAQAIRRPLFRIDDDRWGDAAGIMLRLAQDGTPMAVQGSSRSMFTDAFAARGDEDALVTLANLGLHSELRERADTTVVFESGRVFIDVSRIVPGVR